MDRAPTPTAESQTAESQTELRLRSLAAGTAVVVWYAGPNGAMVHPNPGIEAFTGLRPEQYLGWRWIGSIHPEDAQRLFDAIQGDVTSGQPAQASYRLRRHDGEYREMDALVSPILRDSEIAEWVGVSIDVTERNAADRLLRASVQRLGFIDRLTARMCVLDEPDMVAAVTEGLARQLGADACLFARLEDAGRSFRPLQEWRTTPRALLPQAHPVASLGLSACAVLKRGGTIAVRDAFSELDPVPSFSAAASARALICSPIRLEGSLAGLLLVVQALPRAWTSSEFLLARQVAARFEAHLARVRD